MSLSIQRVKSRKTAALRKKPQWGSVKYMYAVRNDRLPGKTKQTVCGRALGERKDGQCFFVEVDLPWMVEPKWRWQDEAKRRLDSFLDPTCTCVAEGTQVKVCDGHVALKNLWAVADSVVNESSLGEAEKYHTPQREPGPVVDLVMIYPVYSWIRWDRARDRIVCQICNGFEEPYPSTSTYRNQFAHKHSACGFPAADYEKSIAECTLTTYYNVRDALQKRRTELYKGVMTLDVLIHYCERMNGAYLPEKMSEDEAFKFILERCHKEGVGTLKLGGDVGRTSTL